MTCVEARHHWRPGQDCPAAGCYRQFSIDGFASVWGLGAYHVRESESASVTLGYFGNLVRNLKYYKPLRDRNDFRIAVTSTQLSRFMDKMIPGSFDALALVPANRPDSRSILPYIASIFIQAGIANRIIDLRGSEEMPVMKSIKGTDRSATRALRAEALAGKYQLPGIAPSNDVERFLVMDDVLDTGATLDAIARAIRTKYPNAEIHGVALTYIRDPRMST